jgi:S-DNA-T family DNA segregation ATPase FtsK/SpoIIIE
MNTPPCEHPFESDRVNGPGDFRPDWDVPALGREVTDALARDIAAVRARPAPDPTRKMHLISGAPGYGKTHLFGRLRHLHGGDVQFVFVPSPPDPSRALEYTGWQLVETLFEPGGSDHGPLLRHLARLLAPSVAAYFDQLPPALQAKCTAVRHGLEKDALSVLEVLRSSAALNGYHELANSVRRQFPDVQGGVVRALVLGLSPEAGDARVWLRGEADQIDPERLRELRLDGTSPAPFDVVKGVARLLQRVGVPLVLCLDQLEVLFQRSSEGFRHLGAELMNWLQQVANLIVVVGCVNAAWEEIIRVGQFKSFADRVAVHDLPALTPAQAAELIKRRSRTWEGFDASKPEGWPFDLASVEKFVTREQAPPRGFIKLCAERFDQWVADGKRSLIEVPGGGKGVPEEEAFLAEWSRLLDATRQSVKAAGDYQDAELWAGVEEAIKLAKLGGYLPPAVTLEGYQLQALKKTANDARPGAEVRLVAGGQRASLVLAVSKKDAGVAFGHWFAALNEALGGHVAGAVVVWPREQLAVGKTSQAYKGYKGLQDAGRLRHYGLDAHPETLVQLECLRTLIREAEAGNVQLSGKAAGAGRCRELLVATGVLAKLDLFQVFFHDWAGLTKHDAGAPATTAPTVPGHDRPSGPPLRATAPTATAVTVAEAPVAVATQPARPPGGTPWAEEMLAKAAEKLRARGQPVRPLGVEIGPTFVRLKVEPRDDTDFAKVKRQADNLQLQLGLDARPLIALQAGYISIDVQRPDRKPVPLPALMAGQAHVLAGLPAFPLGVDVAGRKHWLNLAEPASCHLLVAGTTGSGKSELLKSMLAALACRLGPDQVQFILVDPKRVTFNFAGRSPYLRNPVVHDAGEALGLIEECYAEMERRYAVLQRLGKEHVGELTGADALPRVVAVFDEFADLMADRGSKKELEALLKRLGAKARAAGIHLVLGTQRPEASVVTPLLRSNLPGRISLLVGSEKDSKLILDQPDAAYLLGRGDLFWKQGGGLTRLQSPLVTRDELQAALRFQ